MKLQIGVGLMIGAALIPVSMLIGISPLKSILISLIVAVLFVAMSLGMSRLLKRKN
jgi:hypothetical protein